MSIEITPPVPAKRLCRCDGCRVAALAIDGLILPNGWNRISIREEKSILERPLYGDYGGWPPPDATEILEYDYCGKCSARMVEHMRALAPLKRETPKEEGIANVSPLREHIPQ